MVVEEKRHEHDKRIVRRQRVNKRMEEAEKELHELREKLRKQQELCKQEMEA